MKNKLIIAFLLLSFCILANSYIASAKTNDEIIIKDKNLQSALSIYYDFNGFLTEEKADELSVTEDNVLVLDNANISDLEGLQYFDNLSVVYLRENKLINLRPLSKIKSLFAIDFSNNSIKGKVFMDALNVMGKIKELEYVSLNSNELTNINILDIIGNLNKYKEIRLADNMINDISILQDAINLETLDLSDNRITDVSPLKNLKNFKYWLDLQDNCILDYKPIKPILDKICEDGGWQDICRYDYYTNPVDIGVNGKTIKFPYLTAYYKYQAYAEAVPLFKALGGSAKYNKKTETLTCKYGGNVLVMKDFSKNYTLNGKKMSLNYPMRRMQYDLAYVPVKDICKVLDLNYSVTKKRELSENGDDIFYAPKYIEINKDEKELG